jgi:serine/threonine protein kinase
VTQIGEGQESQGAVPQVLTFGAPSVGEVLAERYQLEQHINNDSLGRQIWRGIDVVLRRPVAVVLRYPGGDSASEMLAAAVAASRIVHPHLVGVYDAIDEGDRAYVVREWVDGASLRELVADGPFEPERAAMIAAAVADAVVAVHATGMAHGNIHPGTVLVAADGRVVLTDARSDEAATPESDVRAIGAILYTALTGHWPHAEAGPTALPDAVRDSSGNLASPRQVRGGVPTELDELTMQVLDPTAPPPSSETLLTELNRFEHDGGNPMFTRSGGPLNLEAFDQTTEAPEVHRPAGRKIAIGVAVLLVIAVVGVFGATQALSSKDSPPQKASGDSSAQSTSAPQQTGGNAAGKPTPVKLGPNQVRIVDPPRGSRDDVRDADKTVDGNDNTGWKTSHYNQADFGRLKPGMGIMIDLGEAKAVSHVQVQLSAPGATIELRTGPNDPGATSDGDDSVAKTFTPVGDPTADAAPTVTLPGSGDQKIRYLLIWITKLPVDTADSRNRYQIGVQEITVFVP